MRLEMVMPRPTVFFGDEACQLMRYAGLAERLSCIGFFETNPLLDHNGQTVHLVAQLIWYFLEGFTLRSNDFPTEKSEGFIKYTATQPGLNNDMIFLIKVNLPIVGGCNCLLVTTKPTH